MPTNCCIKNCTNNAVKNEDVRFYIFPQLRTKPEMRNLSEERRKRWLAAINLKKINTKIARVCSRHFISGKCAKLSDKLNPDWVPSLHLGYAGKFNSSLSTLRFQRKQRIARRPSRKIPVRAIQFKEQVENTLPSKELLIEGYTSEEFLEEEYLQEYLDEIKPVQEPRNILIVSEMKKKWNNIRDYYRRDNHPDNLNSKRRKYVFTDLLEFLDPVYNIRGSDCDISNQTLPAAKDTDDDDYESDEEYTPKNVLKLNAISKKHKIQNKNTPTNAQKKMRNTNIIKQMPYATVLTSSTTEENPHLSFLKSFVPEMEEMSPYERLDFKEGMIRLLRSVKFPPTKEDYNERVHDTHLADNGPKIRQPSDILSIRLESSPTPSFAVSTELISPKTEIFTEDFC